MCLKYVSEETGRSKSIRSWQSETMLYLHSASSERRCQEASKTPSNFCGTLPCKSSVTTFDESLHTASWWRDWWTKTSYICTSRICIHLTSSQLTSSHFSLLSPHSSSAPTREWHEDDMMMTWWWHREKTVPGHSSVTQKYSNDNVGTVCNVGKACIVCTVCKVCIIVTQQF